MAVGLNQITKKDLAQGAEQIVNNMLEVGNELDVAVGLAAMENVISEIKSNPNYVNAIRDRVQERGEKGKLKLPSGTLVEQCEVGIKYDYSGDAEWRKLKAMEEELADLRKRREAMLKAIPSGKMLTDPDTGETLIGPPKTSTSSYKVTIAK